MTESLFSKIETSTKQYFGLKVPVNVVAVHSRQINLSPKLVEKWYDEAITWIKSFEMEPKSFSSFGVSGFQEAKRYSFIKADKKLRKRGFDSVSSLSLSASPPVRGLFEVDPHIEISITSSSVNWGISTVIWSWSEKYRPLNARVINELIKSWWQVDYAFAFDDLSNEMPMIKAAHLVFDERTRDGYLIRGGLAKAAYELGMHSVDMIKNVYPYQILSSIHLSYRIGDLTLEDWIKSSDSYGTLSEFSQEHWLWEIPEEQLPAVRQALIENNLLTLYLPDMSRILEDYGNPDN